MKQKTQTKLDIAREELLKIQKSGKLTAETVIEAAKDPVSPLHQYFEWDDSKAAEKWRFQQARVLINYVVEPAETFPNSGAYSFEIIDLSGSKEYKHIDEILSEDQWKRQILTQAVNHLKYWKQKYEKYNLIELKGVMQDVDRITSDEE